MHADVVAVIGVSRPPDEVEQLPVGEHPVGLAGEIGEQAVFDGRQVQRLPAALDDTPGEVDSNIAKADQRFARRLPLPA